MLLSGGLIGLILSGATCLLPNRGCLSSAGRWPTAMALRRSFSPAAVRVQRRRFSLCWRAGRRCGPIILERLPDRRRRRPVLPVDGGPAGAGPVPAKPDQRETQPRRVVCAVATVSAVGLGAVSRPGGRRRAEQGSAFRRPRPRRRGNISSGAGGRSFSVCPPAGADNGAQTSPMVDAFASAALSRLFSPTAHGC